MAPAFETYDALVQALRNRIVELRPVAWCLVEGSRSADKKTRG